MADRNIVSYIKEGVEKGFSIRALKKKLLDNGFPQNKVDEAANKVKKEQNMPSLPQKNTKEESQKLPTGAKICSILYYIQSIVLFLYPFTTLVAGSLALGTIGAALGGVVTIILFVILVPLAVLFFFVGKGIGNSRKWARITAIILSSLGFLIGIFQFFGSGTLAIGITSILFNGFIGGYLLFSQKAKEVLVK